MHCFSFKCLVINHSGLSTIVIIFLRIWTGTVHYSTTMHLELISISYINVLQMRKKIWKMYKTHLPKNNYCIHTRSGLQQCITWIILTIHFNTRFLSPRISSLCSLVGLSDPLEARILRRTSKVAGVTALNALCYRQNIESLIMVAWFSYSTCVI
jgi:hypothetical protein